MDKQLVFSPRTHDLKEFELLGREARAAGFTHLVVSDLADRADFQGEEADSPWCEWSAILPSLFKHVTPAGLEEAYPKKNVKTQFDFLKAKHAICKRLGLRAAYYGTEPHWLHEKVYRQHPAWRGSRADNSLRATGMYYSPNTDHPEVRAVYREGVRMLCSACPLIDIFTFNTNDSGGFYPWEKRLFNFINGPTGGLGKDMGRRVVDFLKALRAGAADAGVDAHIFTNVYGWFKDDEMHLVLRSLEPGVGVNGLCPGEHAEACSLANIGGSVWFVAPILNGAGAVPAGIQAAKTVRSSPAGRFISGGNDPDYFHAFAKARSLEAPTTQRQRLNVMYAVAAEIYGVGAADTVVDGWLVSERAQAQRETLGLGEFGGGVMLRWLTRPLVAHQNRLTAAEREYWEPYIYQSKKAHPDVYLDYLNLSGYTLVYNWEQASTISCGIDTVEGTLAQAAALFDKAAELAESAAARKKLIMEACRRRAERSMHLTTRHFLQVGTLIYLRDRRPAERTPDGDLAKFASQVFPSLPHGDMGETGLWYLYRALRWELDNVYELIAMLKKAPGPVFWTAPRRSFVGPLALGPELIDELEKKAEIMLKHWRDAEIGWGRPTLGG